MSPLGERQLAFGSEDTPARPYRATAPLDGRLRPYYRIITMNTHETSGCCPSVDPGADLRPVEGPEADSELAAIAKAIGHPARVAILRLLVRQSSCVCGEIVESLPLAQSTVSQHLKVLKDAKLIRGEIDGPRVCYCLEPRTLRRLKALVGGL